jgi:chromosome partitioning protein
MQGTDARTPRRTPHRIALLNQKGGVGKTTSTVNIAAAMATAGKRVCLIDLDPQAHLTLHLGVDPAQSEQTVYDLFVDPDLPASAVRIEIGENLHVIPAEVDLAAAEVELASHPDRQRILEQKMAPIIDEYDYVLIDCPPSLGLLTLNALTLSEEVMVPMQAHFLSLQGVGKLLETVGLVCRSVNPGLKVSGVILCMHEGQTTLAREVVADLEGYFESCRDQDVPWRECRVLHPPVRRNIKLAEAPSFGQSIFDYSPWCPGAIDYRRLAQGLMEAHERLETPAQRPDPEPDTEPESATTPASAIEHKPAPAEPPVVEITVTPEATRAATDSPVPAHPQ